MKNILFLSYLNLWSLDANKGAPSFSKTIEAYIADGWNVTIIQPIQSHGTTPRLDGMKVITFRPLFYWLVRSKKLGWLGRILHSLQGNYTMYRLGKKALAEFKYDAVIYSYEVHGVNAGKKLSKNYKLLFITRFQGTILAPVKNNWINRIIKYPHFQALATTANLTIMTDDGTFGDRVLKELGNKSQNVLFLRNGVDYPTQQIDYEKKSLLINEFNINKDEVILMTLSRLVKWKRIERAIDALANLRRNGYKCKLIVVGDGDAKDSLVTKAKLLSVDEYVIFAGAISHDDVYTYISLCDIFLSLYDLSNLGNPLFEAMISGKPIITVNSGNTSSVIEDRVNGMLVPISEILNIYKYIMNVIDDVELAEQLRKGSLAYSCKNFYSWQRRMDIELEYVNKLLDKQIRSSI